MIRIDSRESFDRCLRHIPEVRETKGPGREISFPSSTHTDQKQVTGEPEPRFTDRVGYREELNHGPERLNRRTERRYMGSRIFSQILYHK